MKVLKKNRNLVNPLQSRNIFNESDLKSQQNEIYQYENEIVKTNCLIRPKLKNTKSLILQNRMMSNEDKLFELPNIKTNKTP